MTYERSAGSDMLPFAHPALGQYVALAFRGKHPKGDEIPLKYFADAEDPSDDEPDPDLDDDFLAIKPRKALTPNMIVWAAAIVRPFVPLCILAETIPSDRALPARAAQWQAQEGSLLGRQDLA